LKHFLSFRIFEQLALALKTEFFLKMFKPEGSKSSPASYAYGSGWDIASWWARNSWEMRYSLLLLSFSDYKRIDTSLYFMITNFQTDFKPQVKSAMAWFLQHLHYTQRLNNYGLYYWPTIEL